MEDKAPRRTREPIPERCLNLFDAFGEPGITTTVIADEPSISPDNPYSHFGNEDAIVNSPCAGFDTGTQRVLAAPPGRRRTNDDDEPIREQVHGAAQARAGCVPTGQA